MSKTTPIPLHNVVDNGALVYEWLGGLWTQLFSDHELISNNCQAGNVLSTQLYLNFMETIKLMDRHNAPAYHRERWRMEALRMSDRNTGNAAALKMGGRYTPKVGVQDELPFINESKFKVGGYVSVPGVTTYPLTPGVADVLTSISDSISNPKHILVRGIDFYIEDETIVFVNGNDPFDLGFPTRHTEDGKELAIWISDAIIDKDYVYDHIGYVLGIRGPNNKDTQIFLNALWDLYNMGAPLAVFKSGVAAMLGEPYILDATERVELIIDNADKKQVVTDKHVYTVPIASTLHTNVKVGAVLRRGDLLTDSVRIYDNVDPSRLAADSDHGARLRTDIDAIFLPPGFFRTNIKQGLGLSWTKQPITYQGEDANGNPKVKFKIYGSDADTDAFWSDYWDWCEDRSISSTACFSSNLRDRLLPVEDAVWGTVSPLEYFLYNFLKANLLIIAIDSDKLSVMGRNSLQRLTLLRNVIPAHVCLYVTERRTVPTDEYDISDEMSDTTRQLLCKSVSDTAGADEYEQVRLTYGDARPIVHFIPKCVGATNG